MLSRSEVPVVWEGSIPLRYAYTAGVAGEHFLRALQKGRLLVSQCHKCRRRYVPPRAYCTRCFRGIADYRTAPRAGYVYSYTLIQSADGPRTVGLIRFRGVEGGLLHFLDAETPVRLGLPVVPVFKPPRERRGSLTDVAHFAPLAARRTRA